MAFKINIARRPALILCAAALLGGLGLPLAAQQLTPGQMQQVLGLPATSTDPATGRPGTPAVPGSTNGTPPAVIMEPSIPLEKVPAEQTSLENVLSSRAGTSLRQIGYDQAGVGRSVLLPQQGGTMEGYVLGPGDDIIVSLRGQEASENRVQVDRNGRVILPKIGPINAAGRTFGDFRRDLEAAVSRAYVATQAYASIGNVRQIRVTVSGEINSPGTRVLTGLSSAMDAILVSNGVKRTGSLRNIQIVRGGQRIRVDLYSVLLGVSGREVPLLTDGDQIVVPALGPVVAVAGPVRIPGIYEMAPGQTSMPANALIALAGGYSVRGRYNLSVVALANDGRTQLSDLGNENAAVRDSDVLLIRSVAEQTTGRVTLTGSAGSFIGAYAVQASRLSDMFKAPGALGEDPYTLFAVISRRDPVTLLRSLIAVTPAAILRGSQDFALQSDDIVQVYSRNEATGLIASVANYDDQRRKQDEQVRNPQNIEPPKEQVAAPVLAPQLGQFGGLGLSSLTQGGTLSLPRSNSSTAGASVSAAAATPQTGDAERAAIGASLGNAQAKADTLKVDAVIFLNFLRDHIATLSGAIRGPGTYLVGPDLDLMTLVQAGGGTVGWSDTTGVERVSTQIDVTSGQARTAIDTMNINSAQMSMTIVRPRDQFRFPEAQATLQTAGVTLQGEVRHPGVYPTVRGERLSELLARAGGLSNVAYPYGAVFLRKSVAAREREGYQREARELENQMIMALGKTSTTAAGQTGLSADAFVAIRTLIDDLRNQVPLGRISVEADPAVLAIRPESDPLLEPGDVLYIPQRPSTVTVLGEVMNVSSFPIRANMTVRDYVGQAGGYSRYADESLTFVVLPNGSAYQAGSSWLSSGASTLPPGSTIVVPRDVEPFDLKGLVLNSIQILSQVAVTAASLSVLSR